MWVIIEDPQTKQRRRVAVARTAQGVWVGYPGGAQFLGGRATTAGGVGEAATANEVRAPMTGRVVQVGVKAGEKVEAGSTLVVLEAMKMEYKLAAPRAGEVERVQCKAGELVDLDAILVTLKP